MKRLVSMIVQAGMLLLPVFVMAEETLRVAITTTTENSGIATVLNQGFTQHTDVRVHTIVLGSGQALRVAREGDVDVVFAHAPELEQEFIRNGWGTGRLPVMHNDFIIVGPENDPAGVKGSTDVAEAFAKIATNKQQFVSRGDNSGTHIKENALWQKAGLTPAGRWYVPSGAGMGMTLIMADNLQAYTLTDRGTYLASHDKLALHLLYEGDEILYNPYHIMIVNPEKYPHTSEALARQYVDFVTGETGQKIISNYRIKGQNPFVPGAVDVVD